MASRRLRSLSGSKCTLSDTVDIGSHALFSLTE